MLAWQQQHKYIVHFQKILHRYLKLTVISLNVIISKINNILQLMVIYIFMIYIFMIYIVMMEIAIKSVIHSRQHKEMSPQRSPLTLHQIKVKNIVKKLQSKKKLKHKRSTIIYSYVQEVKR